MSSRTIKNTRLVYTDEKNLKIYQALSPEDFKEFFMTYLTYKSGSEIQITDFNNPLLYALFLSFKDKIDYNEEKWERQAAAKRENGKKGGRPKKTTLQDTVGTEFDTPKPEEYKNGNIQENCQNVENEQQEEIVKEVTPQPVEVIEEVQEVQEMTPEEEKLDDFSEELYNLLESDDMNTIKNILERSVDYTQFNKDEYEVYYKSGDCKINEICKNYHLSHKDICDLEQYCQEFSISYLNRVTDRMMCAAS